FGRIADRTVTGPLSEALIDDPNAKVRESIAFGLGEMEDIRAMKSIISALLNTGETPEVRARAAEAAGKIVSVPENIKLLGPETIERVTNILINMLPKSPANELKSGEELFATLTLTALLRIHPVTAIDPVAAQLAS